MRSKNNSPASRAVRWLPSLLGGAATVYMGLLLLGDSDPSEPVSHNWSSVQVDSEIDTFAPDDVFARHAPESGVSEDSGETAGVSESDSFERYEGEESDLSEVPPPPELLDPPSGVPLPDLRNDGFDGTSDSASLSREEPQSTRSATDGTQPAPADLPGPAALSPDIAELPEAESVSISEDLDAPLKNFEDRTLDELWTQNENIPPAPMKSEGGDAQVAASPGNEAQDESSERSHSDKPAQPVPYTPPATDAVPQSPAIATVPDEPVRMIPVPGEFDGSFGLESILPDTRTDPQWQSTVGERLLQLPDSDAYTLIQTLHLAVSMAPEIAVLRDNIAIQDRVVLQEQAAFDWTSFLENSWTQNSNPIGSDLDGNPNRLRDKNWNFRGGARKLTNEGEEFEVSQSLGWRNSNSQFINPNNQGTARLNLDYERPLLRGAGKFVNTGRIRIAQIARNQVYDEMVFGLESYLQSVSDAYFDLVLERARYSETQLAVQRSRALFDFMDGRREVDVRENQIARAAASLASLESQLIDARHFVRQQQERLLRLIFAAAFAQQTEVELVTSTTGPEQELHGEPFEHVQAGLKYRAEVHRAIRQIKTASVQHQLARNEILPQLNLVLNAYSAGLEDQSNVGGAFKNQFTTGQPGFTVGLNYELPYRSRAARAAADQQRILIHRFRKEFEAVTADVTFEIRQQLIELSRQSQSVEKQREALEMTRQELEFLQKRLEFLVDGTNVSDLYLDNLISTQQRYLVARLSTAQAHVGLTQAYYRLLRSKGMLRNLVCGGGVQHVASSMAASEVPPDPIPEPAPAEAPPID